MASSEQTDNTDSGPGGDGRAAAVGSLAGGVKSEISLVHEIALRRSLSVTFDVERESGPPHLKNFVTRCTCGNISVTGEGNSKKVSKKRAAEVMLEKLNALPPLPLSAIKIKRPVQTKKKNKNLIKMQKAAPDYGMQINPISRLIQIQQAKKEKEPFYTFIGDRGQPRKREFVIQVQVGDHTCQGIGPNKKLAKRSAAEAMLQELGYSKPSPQPIKPAIKTEGSPSGDKKVSFIDQDLNQTSRQLVPGVILMPDSNKMPNYCVQGAMIPGLPNMMGNHSAQTIATIAKELLETRTSGTAEAIRQRTAPGTMMRPLQRHEEMLFYMGEVLCFTVQFTDFPKQNNKNELLSLVTLSTVPPQVSHGAGVARDESHDMAAQQALRTLAVLDQPQMQPQMQQQHKPQPLMDVKLESVDHRGDGLHLKQEV